MKPSARVRAGQEVAGWASSSAPTLADATVARAIRETIGKGRGVTVPFGFLRRGAQAVAEKESDSSPPGEKLVSFDGLTEEWRLVGQMHLTGRLSDAMNRRDPISISDVSWAPIDGSTDLAPVPGLRIVDPYDLILVLAGEDTLPVQTDAERIAHRVHKVPFDLALELPPFRVIGTVYLFPGTEPDRLLERGREMFVPVVDAVAFRGDDPIVEGTVDAILVNRFYLRDVEQVDRATGRRITPLPGTALPE